MKKTFLRLKWSLLLLLLAATMASAQPVSDEVYYNRLFYLCKVWGHAKYYHTQIAAGLVNWDDELLPVVTAARNAPTNAAFNEALLAMLNNAGPMGTSTVPLPVVPDSLNNNLDLSWIQSEFFSESVRAMLMDIKDKFRPQSNVYIQSFFTNSNPKVEMDSLYYSESDYPTEEKRMLSMFRYWNQVNYLYPYKKIMDQDWDVTLLEFIPEIASAPDALSFSQAFRKLTTRINDTHGAFGSPAYNAWLGTYYPPFLVRQIEGEMVITKVLEGIEEVSVGDVIMAMDGEEINTLKGNLRQYSYGSNDPSIEKNLNFIIMTGPEGPFPITVNDGNSVHSTTLMRNATNYSALQANTSPIWSVTVAPGGCTYGIVDMGRLETSMIATMFADFSNTDAIIFDQRNYPNGTLWTIVNYIFPAPIHIANFTVPDITYPGRLYWSYATIGTGTNNPYQGKIILLFDERTISQAEYTCMGIGQFPGAIKIGSMTAAADGNVSRSYNPGKAATYFTGLGTYYPDYTPTQRTGIIPDYEVHPTIAGIRAGNDEVLAFALNCDLLASDYCTSSGCNADNEWVQTVSLGSYTKNSGYNIGYGDFTEAPIDVQNGTTYNLSVTPYIVNNLNRRQYIRAWIDFNMDGDFSETNELVLTRDRIKVIVSGNVYIPAGLTGQTRMRVSMKYNAAQASCENFAYGEVEDYTLNITAPPLPIANFTGNPTFIYTGQSVQFTDQSTNIPTTWSWTFEGGTPAASTVQNPSVVYNVDGIYDVTLVVSNSSGSNSLTITDYITVNQGTTYCSSHSTSNANEYISKVAIGSFTNTTGPSFYSDFTGMNIQLVPGSNTPVTLTPVFPKKSRPEYWRIWIDYNIDGDFTDAGEEVFAANNLKIAATGSILIPSSATGQTRMRVSMKNASAPTPCETFTGGEVEDYTVSFAGGSKTLSVSSEFDVELYPVPAKDVLNVKITGNPGTVQARSFDSMGKLLDSWTSESGTMQINLTFYPKGLYYIRFNSQDQEIVRKFIKQ
jgi:carboxyl-terminal processing protease